MSKIRHAILPVATLLVPAVLFLALCSTAFAAPAQWQTYSCTGPHCYGTDRNKPLGGSTGVWGGSDNIDLVVMSINNSNGGNSQLSNELWLADEVSSCSANGQKAGNSACWVEEGYLDTQTYGEAFFWADVRPVSSLCGGLGGCGYHLHVGSGGVTSNDYADSPMLGETYNDNANDFYIFAGAFNYFTGHSSNNLMTPTTIDIGEELSGFGTSGTNAYSPKAHWTNNEWQDVNFQWNYFRSDGSIGGIFGGSDNPPWAGWESGQKPSQSSTGGVLYACTKYSTGSNPC